MYKNTHTDVDIYFSLQRIIRSNEDSSECETSGLGSFCRPGGAQWKILDRPVIGTLCASPGVCSFLRLNFFRRPHVALT